MKKYQKSQKNNFKKLVKQKILKTAFEYLKSKKETHSKMNNLEYDDLNIQKYLKSNNNLSNDQKYFLFKLRTKMTELKANYKNKYVDEICSICRIEEESQSHLMECEILI